VQTTRMQCRFTVKEDAEGQPFLMAEPVGSMPLPILEGGFLSIGLKPGTSLQDAQALARSLNDKVSSLAYTGA